ncbi:uncharacterized protein LOC111408984 [Olea europaea var. sylvestris]|uniref:uncharacterized protein LOC111408984 n=1 Tax=Olea europaea var. sylvestris TaxID=158386 RepID=UPI000C1D3B85|nr:uncharacterized protein LOC111408984 [Olea europaea var. sylvestris]
MAIELCSDNLTSTNVSPRISFSHDFSQADVVPVEKYIESSSSSTGDFDFCVFRRSFDQESSLADDIFLDGKILPVEIKKKLAAPPKRVAEPPLSPPHPPPQYDHKINSTSNKKSIGNSEEKKNKSFWQFNRSSSLNCGGNGGGHGRSLCPLPLLSRSNSTGSATSSKRSSISKCSLNHKHQQKSSLFSNSAAKQSQFLSSSASQYQKPPLKKNIQGSYGINPVLKVPTASLFCMGSIFSGDKDKNKSKKL